MNYYQHITLLRIFTRFLSSINRLAHSYLNMNYFHCILAHLLNALLISIVKIGFPALQPTAANNQLVIQCIILTESSHVKLEQFLLYA